MKNIITIIFLLIGVSVFAQTTASKRALHVPGKAIKDDNAMPIVYDGDSVKTKQDKTVIKLKPTQLAILNRLDSARNVFTKEVERNKEVIATFNALMQRSTSLNEQSKQAYDLILEAAGYDPKKYMINGGDLSKGELNVLRKP